MTAAKKAGFTGARKRTSWLHAAVGIFTSPRTSFAYVGERSPWVGILFLVTAATVVEGLVASRYTLEAVTASLREAGIQSTEAIQVFVYSSLALSPVLILVGWLVDAVLIWLLATAFGSEARFRKVFSMTAHVSLINFLGGIVSFLVFLVRTNLGENLGGEDVGTALGVNLLVQAESGALELLYSRVNPFGIWFSALVAVGSTVVLGLPRTRSWLLVGIHWAATTALLFLTSSLAESLA